MATRMPTATKKHSEIIPIRSRLRSRCFFNQDSLFARSVHRASYEYGGVRYSRGGRKDVRVSELWPREMFLGLGLRDGGRWIDACIACVEGVSPHGDSWVEGFGVEVFKVNGIIRPRHRVWHDRSTKEIQMPG